MARKRTIPEGSKARFPVYMDDATFDALENRLHEEKRTKAQWVLEAILEKLRRPARPAKLSQTDEQVVRRAEERLRRGRGA